MASTVYDLTAHLEREEPGWTEEYVRALYKAMPGRRDISPAAYDSKDRFWSSLILASQEALQPGSAVTLSELQRRFTRKGVPPLCLEQVVLLMLQRKELVHARILRQEAEAVDSKAVTRAMWGLVAMVYKGSADPARNLDKEPLYLADAMNEQGKELLRELNASVVSRMIDGLATLKTLRAAYDRLSKSQPVSRAAIPVEILLAHLIVKGSVRHVPGKDGSLLGIRFGPVKEEKPVASGWLSSGLALLSSGALAPVTVSERDSDILTVKVTLQSAQARQGQLSERMALCKRSALKCHKSGEKRAALLHMKRMKAYQEAQLKQTQVLYTLEDIINAIGAAESDLQVHDAVKAGTATLKSVLNGISVEEVEDAMDELHEVMESQQEVQDAIAAPGVEAAEADLAELEAELNEIISGQAQQAIQESGAAEATSEEETAELESQLAALQLETHNPTLEQDARQKEPLPQAGC